ncbi:MAG: exonuclease RecJ [Haloferacaceae archaeon]
MSGTDAADALADPTSVAAALGKAPFVRLLAAEDGDSMAAAGVLADAFRTNDVPFQVRTTDDPDAALADGLPGGEPADRTLVVGHDSAIADATVPGRPDSPLGEPASVGAYRAALELGGDPDPVLTLAGAIAAGTVPGDDGTDAVLDRARDRDLVRRRPGVGLPTDDPADGLAHSTLLVAPFSGDVDAATSTLEEWGLPSDPGADLEASERERFASLLAVEVATAPESVPRAATAVGTALRPYATDGPFATLAGYADVLDVLARERPGRAIALALGGRTGDAAALRAGALEAWRDHAREAHRAVRNARTGRYDGSMLARVDAESHVLPTVARLLCAYRSPEPVVIVVDEGAAAAASRGPAGLGETLGDAAAEFDGTGFGTSTRARARFDGDSTAFAAAVRERL